MTEIIVTKTTGVEKLNVIPEKINKKAVKIVFKNCELENLNFLQYCNQLTTISFQNCKIASFTIENFTNKIINKVDFLNCEIDNFETCQFSFIKTHFYQCQVKTLTGLNTINLSILEGNFKNLESLSLSENLEKLSICYCTEFKSLSGISQCKKLETIIIENCPLENIDELKNCLENLTYANFSQCKIQNINCLKNAFNLETLRLLNTHVNSLKPLKNCFKLEDISCMYSPIRNIKPLYRLPNLKMVEIKNTKLAGKIRIPRNVNDELILKNNKITSIENLHELKARIFDVSKNWISNLSLNKSLNIPGLRMNLGNNELVNLHFC